MTARFIGTGDEAKCREGVARIVQASNCTDSGLCFSTSSLHQMSFLAMSKHGTFQNLEQKIKEACSLTKDQVEEAENERLQDKCFAMIYYQM